MSGLFVFCLTGDGRSAARQEHNVLLDRKKNILSAAGLWSGQRGSEITELYEARIVDRIIDLDSGEDVTDGGEYSTPADYDQLAAAKEAASLPAAEDLATIKRRESRSHVYIVTAGPDDPTPVMYVFPIRGYGLWSMLKGFLALDADLRTVRGLTYYQHGETPGLGGEVDNPEWKAKWSGKLLFDEQNEVQLRLIKNADDGSPSEVDALSGATITSRGVQNMLQYWMGRGGFGPYLDRLRTAARPAASDPSAAQPST